MIVMIDAMAKRYGRLPSEIITEASTFDMVIMDAAMSYEAYQVERQRTQGSQPQTPDVDESTLLEIWNKR